ncbi:putative lipid-binding protein AIR1 [Citrus clementina]|uniref:putative lipid-binding protein AIR1 n=1 Tax=Citrus clementina TaxID=85681 RepID=UPI0007636AD5|nr:putative lipid-binding protein AIR1 [Citrus x clementina]
MASASKALVLFFTVLMIATSIPSSSATSSSSCPKNTFKLDACVDLLNGLAKVNLGELVPTPNHPCCSLLGDLVRVQARVCLCTSLKLNVLDLIKLDIPKLSVNLLLNQCRPKRPCTRTLTAVHDAMPEDVVYPAEIIKIFFDHRKRNNTE